MTGMTDELIGWDSITTYLGVSRVTAWMWAKKYGMPVVVLPSGRIWASREEIKTWVIANSIKIAKLNNIKHS